MPFLRRGPEDALGKLPPPDGAGRGEVRPLLEEDYRYAKEVAATYRRERKWGVLLSPAFGFLAPERLAGWMVGDGLDARLQLQLHKLVWDRTGEECEEVTTGGKPVGIALVSGGMDSLVMAEFCTRESDLACSRQLRTTHRGEGAPLLPGRRGVPEDPPSRRLVADIGYLKRIGGSA